MDAKNKLPIKKVPSMIKLWKITPYKDSQIYIRQFGDFLFEYLAVWNGQIYTDNIIITPEEGKKKLTNAQEHTAFAWIFAAATTTVDMLRGEGASKAQQDRAKGIIDVLTKAEKPKGVLHG